MPRSPGKTLPAPYHIRKTTPESFKVAYAFAALPARYTLEREKHPVTPGPIVPAREMLGDLLLEMGEPGQAAKAYEAVLTVAPNRFGSLLGAARAAKQMQDTAKARSFYSQLAAICDHADGERAELQEARRFLRAK